MTQISSSNFKGITSYQLKILGIILMVFDHVHQMFHANGVPIWFTGIGRLVAPIFLFLASEGFYHTSNKKKYMFRLWLGYALMSFCSYYIQQIFPSDIILINTIFGTLFLSVFYMYMIDIFIKGIKSKSVKNVGLSVLGMAIPFAITIIILQLIEAEINTNLVRIIMGVFPSPILVEGSVIWIGLAVAFYLLRKYGRIVQLLPLIALSIALFVLGKHMQSLMIFAAIPIGLYNGKPGRKGIKYFFYFFYPIHIYVLYIISYFVNK